MICPTCHRPDYEPGIAVVHDDSAYRAERRKGAAETVAWYRVQADARAAAGRLEAAAVWRQEADKLEASCARVWGALNDKQAHTRPKQGD